MNGNRNGRPIRLHLDDDSVVDDQRILEYAPSYRLSPLAAELFGGERVWRYDFSFNETDASLIATRVPRARRVHPLGRAA